MSLLAMAHGRDAHMLPRELFGYEVVESLGEGAGSQIYVVSDPTSRQLYALKHVQRKTDRDVRFIEQLENEHTVGQRVCHKYVRRALDLKVSRNLLRRVTEAALLLELVDGMTLDMCVPDDLPGVIECFIRVAQGLEAMHAAGYVHCDLKPINILLTGARGPGARPTGVKIIDLGQSCPIGTVKQRIQGTPDYIAPEQVKRQAVTIRTDIFNFGATLYWVLCRRKLPTLFTLRQHDNSFLLEDELATPATINPNVPETLSNLVMECVRTHPNRRPENMQELIQRLHVIHHAVTRSSYRSAPAAG